MKHRLSLSLFLLIVAGIACGIVIYFIAPKERSAEVLKEKISVTAEKVKEKELQQEPEIDKAATLFKKADSLTKAGKGKEALLIYRELISNFPDTEFSGETLLKMGKIYEKYGEDSKAISAYQEALGMLEDPRGIDKVHQRLGRLNIELLLSPRITPDSKLYEVKTGDTLFRIAAKFNATAEIIKKINRLKGDLIKPGMRFKIPTAVFSISIDKGENILVLKSNGHFFKSYRIATGKDNLTPSGIFKVVNKVLNPVWYKTGAIIPSGSPENILGTRWLGLSMKGYGIHGTTIPESIGTHCTEGCVRMRNEDAEEVFSMVSIGTDVEIE